MKKPIITFLSDFGTKDGFTGSVKGRIKSIAPQTEIIDISHDIPVFDTRSAAYTLLNYSQDFPEGTIHLAVVDPSVGSQRGAIIVKSGNHFFVGPDNGLFSLIYQREKFQVHHIKIEVLPIYKDSRTFHGRDIFAPAAALIANGEYSLVCGNPVQKIKEFDLKSNGFKNGQIKVGILTVDHFGNIITGLHKEDLVKSGLGHITKVRLKDQVFTQIHHYYAKKAPGEWVVLWNSLGFLEIAVNKGHAASLIQLDAQNDYVYIQTD